MAFPGLGSITVPVDVRLSNVRVNAVGLIAVRTIGGVDYITQVARIGGSPSDPNGSWVQADVEAYLSGQWGSIGTADFAIESWSLVPEHASMAALGAGLAGLLALRRRKP